MLMRSREPASPRRCASVVPRSLCVLQTGMQWFDSGSGGLDRVYFDLFNALPGQGIDVRGAVVGPSDVASLTNGRIRALAPADAGFAGRLLGTRRTLTELAANGNFHLVAAHFAFHIATALDRLRGLPLVMHFHGPWAEESRLEGQGAARAAVKRMVERYVFARAERFIVLSQAFAALLRGRYGVDERRIRIVPGSVDLARFATGMTRLEARAELGWPTGRPILLTIRRLAARMGLDRLIEAMGTIVRAEPDALLFIGGRGRMEAGLIAQVLDKGLGEHVRFLGFLPDHLLPIAYRAADINVVPTTALEGFGLTAAEALAAGTPSMVTPIGALPEVVSDLSPDLVFASGEIADLADGLIQALRGELSIPGTAACRAYAEDRFSTSVAAARVAAVYREVAR